MAQTLIQNELFQVDRIVEKTDTVLIWFDALSYSFLADIESYLFDFEIVAAVKPDGEVCVALRAKWDLKRYTRHQLLRKIDESATLHNLDSKIPW